MSRRAAIVAETAASESGAAQQMSDAVPLVWRARAGGQSCRVVLAP